MPHSAHVAREGVDGGLRGVGESSPPSFTIGESRERKEMGET